MGKLLYVEPMTCDLVKTESSLATDVTGAGIRHGVFLINITMVPWVDRSDNSSIYRPIFVAALYDVNYLV